jgi:hypothetical protein
VGGEGETWHANTGAVRVRVGLLAAGLDYRLRILLIILVDVSGTTTKGLGSGSAPLRTNCLFNNKQRAWSVPKRALSSDIHKSEGVIPTSASTRSFMLKKHESACDQRP